MVGQPQGERIEMEAATLETLKKVARHAAETAEGIRKVATGKSPETATHSNAESFAAIANMLSTLSHFTLHGIGSFEVLITAVRRISDLQVRGASELIEQENWKKLCMELQAVAQDALVRLEKPSAADLKNEFKAPKG